MSKQKKPAEWPIPTWEVYRGKSSPAAYVGRVHAKDKAAALKQAIEQFAVAPQVQERLIAIREN